MLGHRDLTLNWLVINFIGKILIDDVKRLINGLSYF